MASSGGNRPRRVAEQIQRELAMLLPKSIDTAGLGWMTVSAVEVSKDLAWATVFVTFMNNTLPIPQCMSALNAKAAQVRFKLGQVMRIRSVPQIRFAYDESIARGARMSSLINEAVSQDEENAAKREPE